MKIEHCAYQVSDPVAMADWYCENMGFKVVRSADQPVPVRFLADSSGEGMLEIYNNPKAGVPEYQTMDPLTLHLAFVCDDVAGTVSRLVAAGASVVSGPEMIGADELAMLRDPWGFAIQLATRREPMI